jgi:hypothetical protein
VVGFAAAIDNIVHTTRRPVTLVDLHSSESRLKTAATAVSSPELYATS